MTQLSFNLQRPNCSQSELIAYLLWDALGSWVSTCTLEQAARSRRVAARVHELNRTLAGEGLVIECKVEWVGRQCRSWYRMTEKQEGVLTPAADCATVDPATV